MYMIRRRIMRNFFLHVLFIFVSLPILAEEVSFSILATGDLHSRLESHVDPYHLGGMARIKTAMDQLEGALQEHNRAVLRLDAGDCSEGSIYFNSGGGVASFDLMNTLQY